MIKEKFKMYQPDTSERGEDLEQEELLSIGGQKALNLIVTLLERYPSVVSLTYLTNILEGTVELRLNLQK